MPSASLVHQQKKIQQIREALVAIGLTRLDQQAAALGVVRSTAWTIVQGRHKKTGLSANLIIRMLRAPKLPPNVRRVVLEYVEEKCGGLYGHSDKQLRSFITKLTQSGLRDVVAHRCGKKGQMPKAPG
jgi:hypothetical protein